MQFENNLAAWMEDVDWDRTETNSSDGQIFYGEDDDDGYTTWYDENGDIDCRTPTPGDEDDD